MASSALLYTPLLGWYRVVSTFLYRRPAARRGSGKVKLPYLWSYCMPLARSRPTAAHYSRTPVYPANTALFRRFFYAATRAQTPTQHWRAPGIDTEGIYCVLYVFQDEQLHGTVGVTRHVFSLYHSTNQSETCVKVKAALNEAQWCRTTVPQDKNR